jgi:hypothetical protein
VPAGRRELRCEFEPTGPLDLAAGKGTPGRAQLDVDGSLVGQADLPYIILFVVMARPVRSVRRLL